MGSASASSGWRAVAPLPLPHSAPRSFGDHFETVVRIPLGVGALLEHSIVRSFGNEFCGIPLRFSAVFVVMVSLATPISPGVCSSFGSLAVFKL